MKYLILFFLTLMFSGVTFSADNFTCKGTHLYACINSEGRDECSLEKPKNSKMIINEDALTIYYEDEESGIIRNFKIVTGYQGSPLSVYYVLTNKHIDDFTTANSFLRLTKAEVEDYGSYTLYTNFTILDSIEYGKCELVNQ